MPLSLIIALLETFLEWLFKRWFNSFSEPPNCSSLVAMKGEFLSRISWRFWLGGNRVEQAGILFDKAVERYSAPSFMGYRNDLYGSKEAKTLAQSLTAGLNIS